MVFCFIQKYYNDNPKDKLKDVKQQMDGVQKMLSESLTDLMQREEKLDLLVVKTAKIQSNSQQFKDQVYIF